MNRCKLLSRLLLVNKKRFGARLYLPKDRGRQAQLLEERSVYCLFFMWSPQYFL